MRTFTVGLTAEEGLFVQPDPFPHIQVGEEGRGRLEIRVPLGKDLQAEDCPTHLHRASVIRIDGGVEQYLLVAEKSADERALVLLKTPMGYRGGTEWTGLDQSGVLVLAKGKRADGAAGRMGDYHEYLVVIPSGAELMVHRAGRGAVWARPEE